MILSQTNKQTRGLGRERQIMERVERREWQAFPDNHPQNISCYYFRCQSKLTKNVQLRGGHIQEN
jgi:hypothetical protein